MMEKFCSNCGKPIYGAKYCPHCGKETGYIPMPQNRTVLDTKGILFIIMTVVNSATLLFNWLTFSFLGKELGFNCFNALFKVEEVWDEGGAKFIAFMLLLLASLVVVFTIITCKNVLQGKEADKWFYNTNMVAVILAVFSIFIILVLRESEAAYFEAGFIQSSLAPYILLAVSVAGFVVLRFEERGKTNAAVMTAYSEFLRKVLKTGGACKFELINIDNDNIPELVIYMGNRELDLSQVKIYSYYADTIKSINKGTVGSKTDRTITWGYKKGQSEICQRNIGNDGCSIDSIYVVSPENVFRNTVATTEFGSVFTINGTNVSEQMYNAKFAEFTMLDGTSAHDLNEENIGGVLMSTNKNC